MIATSLAKRWEDRLAREGLAPLDTRRRGMPMVRSQIISPSPPIVVDPMRLATALEAWLAGDHSHFDAHALTLLDGRGRRYRANAYWPRRRAKILIRMCEALAAGSSLRGAERAPGEHVLACRLLPVLEAHLAAPPALVDDADDARD